MADILKLLKDPAVIHEVDTAWKELQEQFEQVDAKKPEQFMERAELSFHPFVKLLGFICVGQRQMPGDIAEIGVWKGMSLALVRRLTGWSSRVIGIDPCGMPGQDKELAYFRREIFPDCHLVQRFSQEAFEDVYRLSRGLKLLHIDGGHDAHHVWTDFLLYDRLVLPGGYVVFDDYLDHEYSPEVGPAVDALRKAGFFSGYEIIGQPPDYEAVFVLKKLG